MSNALKIVFAGTPDFAAKHLAALIESEHQVVAVYCPPDKPAGRGKKLTACATKMLALEHGLQVEQPVNFKEGSSEEILAHYQADIMVVVAYGLLLPENILATPRLGCINVHGSILPKWRGAAPIQRSLENGDSETGVTIMQMDKGLDTGNMLYKATCRITEQDTSATLYEKLAQLGPKALISTLTLLSTDTCPSEKQDDSLANYAKKLDKTEAELNWQESAQCLHRKIRAFIPWPVAQLTYHEDDKTHKIRIWQASVVETAQQSQPGTIVNVDKSGVTIATSLHALRLEILQLPGKKALAFSDILNGRANWFQPGQHINGNQ